MYSKNTAQAVLISHAISNRAMPLAMDPHSLSCKGPLLMAWLLNNHVSIFVIVLSFIIVDFAVETLSTLSLI